MMLKIKIYIPFLILAFAGCVFFLWKRSRAQVVDINSGLTANYQFVGNSKDVITGNAADIRGAGFCADRFSVAGSACYFNGVDNYLEVKEGLNVGRAFSFCFWLNSEKTGVEQALFLKGEGCPDGNRDNYRGMSYSITLLPNNRISGIVYAPEGNHLDEYIYFESSDGIQNNVWTFITVTYDNTAKKFNLFLDGEQSPLQVNYKTSPDSFSGVYQTQATFKIAAEENYCGYKHKYEKCFKGSIDDIRIYDHVLNEEEIKSLSDKPYSKESIVLFFIASILLIVLALLMRRGMQAFQYNEMFFTPSRLRYDEGIFFTICLIFMYYFIFSHFSHFSNEAFFGGDTWEYQSLAVNLAKGHGMQKFGCMENFDVYQFDNNDAKIMNGFVQGAGTDDFYRTPGYTVFLGLIYKIFGISPLIAKKIQLLLLVIVAACLPWIAFYFWQQKGFVSGLISGSLFLFNHYDLAGNILTESLIVFFVFLIIVSYIYFEAKGNTLSALSLGVILGLGLLVKGSLLFIPVIIFIFLFIRWVRIRDKRIVIKIVQIFSALVITLMPWSIYSSSVSGELTILSTQSKTLTMDSNNEYSLDGLWHPEWRNDTANSGKYFYNGDNMEDLSPVRRVVNFFGAHKGLFLEMMKNKLAQGFSSFFFLWIMVLLFVFDVFFYLFRNMKILCYLLLMVLIPASVLMYSVYQKGDPKMTDFIFSNFKTMLCTIVLLCFLGFRLQGKVFIRIPPIMTIVLVNFILITLITYGQPRFIEVMDFIFILCAVTYGYQLVFKVAHRYDNNQPSKG